MLLHEHNTTEVALADDHKLVVLPTAEARNGYIEAHLFIDGQQRGQACVSLAKALKVREATVLRRMATMPRNEQVPILLVQGR